MLMGLMVRSEEPDTKQLFIDFFLWLRYGYINESEDGVHLQMVRKWSTVLAYQLAWFFYRRQIKLSTTARQLRDKKVIRSFQSMATMQWSIYGKFRGPGQVLHKYRTFVYRFQWALFSRERDEMMAERRNDHFYIGTWAQLLMIHL